jgi:hypothetical protein
MPPAPVKQEESSSSGTENEDKNELKRSGDDTINNATKKKARTAMKAAAEEAEDNEIVIKEGHDEEAASNTSNNIDVTKVESLDGKKKKWINELGLTNAYGAEKEGLNRIITNHNNNNNNNNNDNDNNNPKYVVPVSFEQVFLLTDFLFPGKGYHSRLFEKASRPDSRSVRQALRTRQKKDPNDPFVSWHKPRKEWLPPSASVLVGIVNVILDM